MVGERVSGNSNSEDATPALNEQLTQLREAVSGGAGTQSFFTGSSVPGFILHLSSGRFVDVNDAFCSLFEASKPRFLEGTIRAPSLLAEDERDSYRLARRFPNRLPDERVVLNGVDATGRSFPAELSVRYREVHGHQLLYGMVLDVTEQEKTERELQEQLDRAKQSNRQVRTLMDKMRSISGVTSELLTLRHEVGVLTRAQSILCDRHGLNFEAVNFYMVNDAADAVEQPFENRDQDPIPLSTSHPAVDVITGDSDLERQGPNVLCFPLRGSDNRFGAVTIHLKSDERALMEQNPHVWNGYKETLSILANLIGLIIHNCRLEERERQASIHDALTGVYNRRYLNQTLRQEVQRAHRYGDHLSLMIIDVDDFKEINDSYGHQEGDRIIQQIARTLEQRSRTSDILCRFGGDEFALLLPSTTGEEAEQLAHRIQERFRESTFTVNADADRVEELPVSVSIGISTLHRGGESDEPDSSIEADQTELLRSADRCMFQAKESEPPRIHRDACSPPSDSGN